MRERSRRATVAFLFIFSFTGGINQAKSNSNQAPYPYGNPVIKHLYTADAAPHVMPDGRVWMVTSVDSMQGGGYETMHSYHLFSSADMRHWDDHGQVFHISDVRPETVDPEKEKWALWAPDMAYRNGKYYLYYPVRILYPDKKNPNGGRSTTSYIGVAECDQLGDPFQVVNPKIDGCGGIDPAVFFDDDGTPYLYWGNQMAAQLKENMYELATRPARLEIGTDRFMEAAWMHKRAGKYFFLYHTKYDWKTPVTVENYNDPDRKKSELAYSVGNRPMGPFTYQGTLNYEPGVNVKNGPRHPEGEFVPWRLTLSNHGGVVEFHGNDYLFYHTSALSSWKQDAFQGEGTWTQRSVCIDQLEYDNSGNVIPVQQTIEGPLAVSVDQPFSIPLAQSVDVEKGVTSFGGVELGSGYYYFSVKFPETETVSGRLEIRLDGIEGELAGTCVVNPGILKKHHGLVETFLRGAHGRRDVYLIYETDVAGYQDVRLSEPLFFAGAPQKIADNSRQKTIKWRQFMRQLLWIYVVAVCGGLVFGKRAEAPERLPDPEIKITESANEKKHRIMEVMGDWIIREDMQSTDTLYKVHGNIYLLPEITWAMTDCEVVVMCEYARQYRVYWGENSTLETRRCRLGGFDDGQRFAPTNFEAAGGTWVGTDTEVHTCYAVSVGNGSVLRGERFMAGKNPDSIIIAGNAEVFLKDSTFPLSISMHCKKGGTVELDLPCSEPMTQIIDASTFLNGGGQYKITFENSVVPWWFIFARDISSDSSYQEATITIKRCQNFLLSILTDNVVGEIRLPVDLEHPIKVGNTTIQRAVGTTPQEVHMTMFGGVYFSGKPDATIYGPAERLDGSPVLLAETMIWGGQLKIDGGPNKTIQLSCTTMDVWGGGTYGGKCTAWASQ